MEFMKFLFLCPRWGSESISADEFIRRVKDAGYDGVEVGLSDGQNASDEVAWLAKSEGLALVTQHWMTADRDMDRHLELFEKRLCHAASFEPLFINSHTGRNLFSLEENLRVFAVSESVSATTGIPVFHETHRGRCCHTPWRTGELLKAMPSLKLVLDMSHWCNVCESLLQDQDDLIEPLLPAISHIHARVGWEHGPQVSDPRAPEWSNALNAHLKWWDKIIAARRAEGVSEFTITPEFGPPPYLPTLPYTCQPIASQWDINIYMMNLLRARYAVV
jgi:hypothetical protein